jgi:hypothetical protein
MGRVAARYDLTADHLASHVLGRRAVGIHRVEHLDHRADAELELALATATQMMPDRIRALRIAGDDGSASCWHRLTPAWCPECVRIDLLETGEVYERALWRLGCWVVCPIHGIPLEDRCSRCMAGARCCYRAVRGLLRLACSCCERLFDPASHAAARVEESMGAFGVCLTPALTRLVGQLQGDLQTALAGLQLKQWGFARPGSGLDAVVRDLTLCLVAATRAPCEPRIEWTSSKPGSAFRITDEPITLASLPHYPAYAALAIIAAILDSLENPGRAAHHWQPNGIGANLNAASFVAWLPAASRTPLLNRALKWDRSIGTALRAAVAPQTASPAGSAAFTSKRQARNGRERCPPARAAPRGSADF